MESKKGACSAHVEAAKANCLKHNRREGRIPSYVNPHLTSTNRTVFEDDAIKNRKSIVPLKNRAELEFTEKTGQKCQKTFTPFREDVLHLREGITDEQLIDFKDRVEALTGWKVLGIWLHQDEGHYHSKYIEGDDDFEINYHAHVLYDCVDHATGKAIRLQRKYFSLRQDLLGASTGMERGNPASMTGKKHRKSAKYRAEAEEQRIASLKGIGDEIDAENARKQKAANARSRRMKDNVMNVTDKFLSVIGKSKKDMKIEELQEQVETLSATIAAERVGHEEDKKEAVQQATAKLQKITKEKIESLEKKISDQKTKIVSLTEEASAWQVKAEALRNWLSVGMAEINYAVDVIVQRTIDPICKHFSKSATNAVETALGTDADISTRKDRAESLMDMAKVQLLKKHVPDAWMASTTEEVMAIAGGEDQASASQSYVIRR